VQDMTMGTKVMQVYTVLKCKQMFYITEITQGIIKHTRSVLLQNMFSEKVKVSPCLTNYHSMKTYPLLN